LGFVRREEEGEDAEGEKMRPIAVFVVSALLVALAAGAALAATFTCPGGVPAGQTLAPCPGATATDDTITGSNDPDNIMALGGDDTVNAKGGNDRVNGDIGNDRLNGQAGTDRVYGQAGDDVISARDGKRDIIDCGRGDDTVANYDRGLDVVNANCTP
jgi:Ca2+-binding RTX toxin-like protein